MCTNVYKRVWREGAFERAGAKRRTCEAMFGIGSYAHSGWVGAKFLYGRRRARSDEPYLFGLAHAYGIARTHRGCGRFGFLDTAFRSHAHELWGGG